MLHDLDVIDLRDIDRLIAVFDFDDNALPLLLVLHLSLDFIQAAIDSVFGDWLNQEIARGDFSA